ncbi:hypothetical protein SDC9_63020 [bioreactor metagenome]|uniref:Thymidylate kinase n=1 Tax=bioreactor metagenome TaxID=1076179 RepID=A0A644XKL6_9ZZZZ
MHQACKLPEKEWERFFEWLFEFECDKLGLPRPDQVILLDMPTERAVEMLRRRESDTHTAGDIHEVDAAYLALCRKTALAAASYFDWQKISCVTTDGTLRTVEDIHAEIWETVCELIGRGTL